MAISQMELRDAIFLSALLEQVNYSFDLSLLFLVTPCLVVTVWPCIA